MALGERVVGDEILAARRKDGLTLFTVPPQKNRRPLFLLDEVRAAQVGEVEGAALERPRNAKVRSGVVAVVRLDFRVLRPRIDALDVVPPLALRRPSVHVDGDVPFPRQSELARSAAAEHRRDVPAVLGGVSSRGVRRLHDEHFCPEARGDVPGVERCEHDAGHVVVAVVEILHPVIEPALHLHPLVPVARRLAEEVHDRAAAGRVGDLRCMSIGERHSVVPLDVRPAAEKIRVCRLPAFPLFAVEVNLSAVRRDVALAAEADDERKVWLRIAVYDFRIRLSGQEVLRESPPGRESRLRRRRRALRVIDRHRLAEHRKRVQLGVVKPHPLRTRGPSRPSRVVIMRIERGVVPGLLRRPQGQGNSDNCN